MEIENLEQYIDCTCEIKSMENELLVLGQVYQVLDSLSLSMDIVNKDGGPMPTAHYGLPVKLCLHRNNKLLIIGGRIYLTNDLFWRISNLSELQSCERRGLFRVPVHQPAKVRLFSEEPAAEGEGADAKIVDISLSGIKFVSEQFFDSASQLELFDLMLPEDAEPYEFRCQIVRRDESERAGYVYRCKFLPLPQKLSDRLCKSIFVLQRNSIKKQRARL